ncbi:MAG: hypothetical protein KY476_17680, partial [Planctomycetes bacterium]|nr:hypothetical protein [Planctomycetota bacterium]
MAQKPQPSRQRQEGPHTSTKPTSTEGHSTNGRALLEGLRRLKRGDFTARLSEGETGLDGELAEAFNDVAVLLDDSAGDLERISRAVGKQGETRQRLPRSGPGGWARHVDAVNGLIDDLVEPTIEVARVIGAVARGDLSQRMAERIESQPVQGAFLQISSTVNTMVDQLGAFASEVTRVA